MVAVNFRQMTNTNQVVVYLFENFITFAIVRKKIEFDQKPESPCNYATSLFVCSDFNKIAIWQFFLTKLFRNVLRFNQMSFFSRKCWFSMNHSINLGRRFVSYDIYCPFNNVIHVVNRSDKQVQVTDWAKNLSCASIRLSNNYNWTLRNQYRNKYKSKH